MSIGPASTSEVAEAFEGAFVLGGRSSSRGEARMRTECLDSVTIVDCSICHHWQHSRRRDPFTDAAGSQRPVAVACTFADFEGRSPCLDPCHNREVNHFLCIVKPCTIGADGAIVALDIFDRWPGPCLESSTAAGWRRVAAIAVGTFCYCLLVLSAWIDRTLRTAEYDICSTHIGRSHVLGSQRHTTDPGRTPWVASRFAAVGHQQTHITFVRQTLVAELTTEGLELDMLHHILAPFRFCMRHRVHLLHHDHTKPTHRHQVDLMPRAPVGTDDSDLRQHCHQRDHQPRPSGSFSPASSF